MIILPSLLMVAAVGLPQMHVVSGPFVSLGEIIEAAHNCGITHLRIETQKPTTPVEPELQQFFNMADARVFLNDAIPAAAQQCLSSWQTKNGRRLNLEPRWWKDDFTADKPGGKVR
jgi:hypothetical protein